MKITVKDLDSALDHICKEEGWDPPTDLEIQAIAILVPKLESPETTVWWSQCNYMVLGHNLLQLRKHPEKLSQFEPKSQPVDWEK